MKTILIHTGLKVGLEDYLTHPLLAVRKAYTDILRFKKDENRNEMHVTTNIPDAVDLLYCVGNIIGMNVIILVDEQVSDLEHAFEGWNKAYDEVIKLTQRAKEDFDLMN